MVPRFGEPADIAAGVVYLASDESKYVTGTELTIDGGACATRRYPSSTSGGTASPVSVAPPVEFSDGSPPLRASCASGSTAPVPRPARRHGRHQRRDAPGPPVTPPTRRRENDMTALFWGGASADLSGWHVRSSPTSETPVTTSRWPRTPGCDILFAPTTWCSSPACRSPRSRLPAFSNGVPQLEDPADLDLSRRPCASSGTCSVRAAPTSARRTRSSWRCSSASPRSRLPVEVIGCPMVHEDDGLVVSSRNEQLTPEQRAAAPVLYRALCVCRDAAAGVLDGRGSWRRCSAGWAGPALHRTSPRSRPTDAPLDDLSGRYGCWRRSRSATCACSTTSASSSRRTDPVSPRPRRSFAGRRVAGNAGT